jgi:plastocyanin
VEVVLRGITIIGLVLAASTATAATVRGTVMLPPEPRAADHDAHWRVENGVLPVGPRVPDPRLDVIVVLEGAANAKTQLPNATVGMHGLRLDPRVVVIPVGGSVEFKNDDRLPHTLFVEKATTLMPATPTPAGQSRTQKFYAAGEYRVRDEEYPHIDGTVLVVQTPYVARLDEKGNFKLDVPEGKYTLKVFYRDRWAVTQAIEVSGHTSEVNVQVPAATPVAAAPATGAKP